MEWSAFVEGARMTSWLVYLGTADRDGHPHVSVVAPGFADGVIWLATRPASKKYRNMAVNPSVAFHWPVQSGGPGEMFATGRAVLHDGPDERSRLWEAGVVPFDLRQFWTGPEDESLAFVECAIDRASLIGTDFVTRTWTGSPQTRP